MRRCVQVWAIFAAGLLLLASCGRVGSWARLKDRDDMATDACATLAKDWSPQVYLSWRSSRMSRFSSITQALPCSSLVVIGNADDGLSVCGDRQAYYRAIGMQQFIAGWNDVADSTGRSVSAAVVDSVDVFSSQRRDDYVACWR